MSKRCSLLAQYEFFSVDALGGGGRPTAQFPERQVHAVPAPFRSCTPCLGLHTPRLLLPGPRHPAGSLSGWGHKVAPFGYLLWSLSVVGKGTIFTTGPAGGQGLWTVSTCWVEVQVSPSNTPGLVDGHLPEEQAFYSLVENCLNSPLA